MNTSSLFKNGISKKIIIIIALLLGFILLRPSTVTKKINISDYVDVPKYGIQDLRTWGQGEVSMSDSPISQSDKMVYQYKLDDTILKEYIDMLEDNGYELVDEYYQKSFRNTYKSYGLVNNKSSFVNKIDQQYSHTPCHVSIWKNDTKWRVDVADGIELTDLGLRRDGKKVSVEPQGRSIEAGLKMKFGNKFVTSDNRLSAKIGNAAVVVDGKKYNVEADWKRSGHNVTLTVNVTKDMAIEIKYDEDEVIWNEVYQLTSVEEVPVSFILTNNNKKITATQKGALSFYSASVRMMYHGDKGESIVYLYAEPIDTAKYPESIEVLCAVNTTPEKSSNEGGVGGFWESSREPFQPDHSKLDCLTCNGTGDCTKCGGSTYVGFGDARAKCNKCHGSGDCTTCGGSGKR